MGVVVLRGNYPTNEASFLYKKYGKLAKGVVVLVGSCPQVSCPMGSCLKGRCPRSAVENKCSIRIDSVNCQYKISMSERWFRSHSSHVWRSAPRARCEGAFRDRPTSNMSPQLGGFNGALRRA